MTKSVTNAIPNELLLYERTRRKLTQEDVAEQLGLIEKDGPKQVGRWERGLVKPSDYSLRKLEKLYGRTAQQLGYPSITPIPFRNENIKIYGRNPLFTGRDDILQKLHRHLNRLKNNVVQQPQALVGMPGVGKTQIAVEYAHRYMHEYHTIALIHAEIPEVLASEFASLAKLLGLPIEQEQDQTAIIEVVKAWLGNPQMTRWLLIFDNFANANIVEGIKQILPPEYYGHVIFTTRMQATGIIAQKIEVSAMEPPEGATLLLRRAKLEEKDTVGEITAHPEYKQSCALSETLGGLPLALDQAGAYIEEKKKTIIEYIELYQLRRKQLLNKRGKFKTNYPESVATTFSLAFDEVYKENPAAIEVLSFFSFLAPDAIPEELITEGRAVLGSTLEYLAADPIALDDAMEALLHYSLIQRFPETKTCSIHRLVQAVHQDNMDTDTNHNWIERCVRAVSLIFPTGEFETWRQCERHLPHALTCIDMITRENLKLLEAALLLYRVGSYLVIRARYNEAELAFQKALAIWEQQLGPEHPNVAAGLNDLASIYQKRGQYEEAEPLLIRAATIIDKTIKQEKIRGFPSIEDKLLKINQELPDRHLQLAIFTNIAVLKESQRRLIVAETYYRRVLELQEELSGLEHPATVEALINLIRVDLKLGDAEKNSGYYTDAKIVAERALAILEKQLGIENPNTAIFFTNLAYLKYHEKNIEQAKQLYQRALAILKKDLGPEHPDLAFNFDTPFDLSAIYALYREQKTNSVAERALAILEKQLGIENPNTAIFFTNLAYLDYRNKHYEQAKQLYQRVLSIQEKHLGLEHPELAASLANLAEIYHKQEHYEQAKQLYQRVLSIQERQLGLEHPELAASLANLAEIYQVQGKYDQAESLYMRALAIQEKLLIGSEHRDVPDIVDNFINSAKIYEKQGEYDQAESLYMRAFEIREKYWRSGNPEPADILNNILFLYEEQGRYDQLELLYLHILDVMEEHGRMRDTYKKSSMIPYINKLLKLYNEQGKYEQAELLLELWQTYDLLVYERIWRGHQDPKTRAIRKEFVDRLRAKGYTTRAINQRLHEARLEMRKKCTLSESFARLTQGKYEQAGPLNQRALRINGKQLGPKHPDTARVLLRLARIYFKQGKYEQAKPMFLRVLAIDKKAWGLEHPYVAIDLIYLALLYDQQGKYEQAESVYIRALAIQEKLLGPEHPDTAQWFLRLARIYFKQGNYEQAEQLYQRVLSIQEKHLGPEHIDIADSLDHLAALYVERGKYEQAEPMYQRALQIKEKVWGPEHPDLAVSLDNLAFFYQKQGNYEQAESFYLHALEIMENYLGPESPNMISYRNKLATFYNEQGKYEQAEGMHIRPLIFFERVYGHEDRVTIDKRREYRNLWLKRGDTTEVIRERMHKAYLEGMKSKSQT